MSLGLQNNLPTSSQNKSIDEIAFSLSTFNLRCSISSYAHVDAEFGADGHVINVRMPNPRHAH